MEPENIPRAMLPHDLQRIVKFAVPANIRQTPEEQPDVIKVALLTRTSMIPLLQTNTIKQAIVPFAVLVNIRRPLEEPPIVYLVEMIPRQDSH